MLVALFVTVAAARHAPHNASADVAGAVAIAALPRAPHNVSDGAPFNVTDGVASASDDVAGASDRILRAPDVAVVRDKIVSLFEGRVTTMNATSTWVADDLVRAVVAAMQNATWVELAADSAALFGGNSAGDDARAPAALGCIAVAQAQGELVNHLNFLIGHMNGTSIIAATQLVRELLEAMEDKTAINAHALALVPGVPPPVEGAQAVATDVSATDVDIDTEYESATSLLALGESEAAAARAPVLAYALVALGTAALVSGVAARRARMPWAAGARGGDDANDGLALYSQADGVGELSSARYARFEGSGDAAMSGALLARHPA
ncbi:hypothetical protein KFE25_003740 [Diacronema lutheri]|uniref:Transmembrane protein n=1 Tax=Diacronema lutheri TaxID=2081491 RepID=A0A8J5X0E0_DIALT|nr:hypothetical protein KFE25_003740 [Diacronema lutheri]